MVVPWSRWSSSGLGCPLSLPVLLSCGFLFDTMNPKVHYPRMLSKSEKRSNMTLRQLGDTSSTRPIAMFMATMSKRSWEEMRNPHAGRIISLLEIVDRLLTRTQMLGDECGV